MIIKNRTSLLLLSSLILTATIVILSWRIARVNQLDSASQELAISAAETAFSSDYPRVLIESSHQSYRDRYPSEYLIRYLGTVQRIMGPLNSLTAIRGSSNIPLIPLSQAAAASYEIDLSFSNDDALLQIEMVFEDNRWLITNFDLFSDLLAN